jgi:hypothetical protein
LKAVELAMSHGVSHWLLTKKAWAQFQASHMAFVVEKVALAQAFSQSKFDFLSSTISPVIRVCIHTSFIYHR